MGAVVGVAVGGTVVGVAVGDSPPHDATTSTIAARQAAPIPTFPQRGKEQRKRGLALVVGILLFQRLYNSRVGQGCGVTQGPALGDVP